jgi:murein DD-endopeptidase MepM/ murein hydrolase activator NlpD
MRRLVVVLTVAAALAVPPRALADGYRFDWPLQPRPAVVRGFDAPTPNWKPGHRGVDLAGAAGQPVYAAGAGTVVFAGELAGRPVVSIAHPGGLRTTYEPVKPAVGAGQLVVAGDVIGELMAGHPECAAQVCLHWGAMWGPASAADYVDPLGLLASTPIRLKPVGAPGRARPAIERPTHGCTAA